MTQQAESPADAQPQPSADPAAPDAPRVLVTGGSGFVGTAVVRELVVRGHVPVCLVRSREKLQSRQPAEVRSRLETVEGDIFDRAALRKAADGCASAIHLIGVIEEKPLAGQTFQRMHVDATRAVLEACRDAGITRYAHMSALGTRPNAVSRYHRTKWEAEELVRRSSLDWTIFQPSLIHGPDGEFMQMMKFFSTSLRQPVMPYFGSGESQIQPVSVRDVAACFVKCLSLPETAGREYGVGGPERMSWKQLYDICSLSIRGRRKLKVPVPVPVAKFLAAVVMPFTPSILVPYKFNVGQVQMSQEDSVCDTAPLERDFGIRLRDFREELAGYADLIA